MSSGDLRYRVGRSFIQTSDFLFRLEGAEYHLNVVRDIIGNEILSKPHSTPPDSAINRLHWHLAAFYFELVGTFECVLQTVAAHHRLPIPRHRVTWPAVEKATHEARIDTLLIHKIRAVYASKEFQELLARRIYVTHWGPAFIQTLSSKGKVVSVGSVRQPDLIAGSATYLDLIRELAELAAKELPAGHIMFERHEK